MPTPNELRQQITSQIVAALEQDTIPFWRRPWRSTPNSGRPANVLSKRPYSGVNPLLLELHASKHGFASRYWGTFRGWQEIGGMVAKRPDHVPPGQWGAQVVYYKPISRKIVDPNTGVEEERDSFLLRNYTLFNADQVVGQSVEQFQSTSPDAQANTLPDFAPAEELIASVGADIRYGGNKAFYVRPTPEGSWPHHSGGDFIQMPRRGQFVKHGAFYETLFHELAHFSETRLGWDHREHGYAMGELVAELTGTNLAAGLGIPDGEDLSNHAAYLKSWLNGMKADSTFIFRASSQASKVTDYLLSFVRKTEPEPAIAT